MRAVSLVLQSHLFTIKSNALRYQKVNMGLLVLKSYKLWMIWNLQMLLYLAIEHFDHCSIRLVKRLLQSKIALFSCQLEVVKVCATR